MVEYPGLIVATVCLNATAVEDSPMDDIVSARQGRFVHVCAATSWIQGRSKGIRFLHANEKHGEVIPLDKEAFARLHGMEWALGKVESFHSHALETADETNYAYRVQNP